MPSFDHQDLKPYRTVVIHVRNSDDLADLSQRIGQDIKDSEQEKRNGVPVTSMWHPVRINDVLKDDAETFFSFDYDGLASLKAQATIDLIKEVEGLKLRVQALEG